MKSTDIKLGDCVRDKVSGAAGVVIGKSKYLYCSDRYLVAPKAISTTGRPEESYWIDLAQLERVLPETKSYGL